MKYKDTVLEALISNFKIFCIMKDVIEVTAFPTVKLYNGVDIPVFGIGVDQVKDLEKGYDALMYAFSIGYRSVDTAFAYGNEEMVGRAIRDCGVPR